jgi:acetylornithine deacetylase/succinyl-diaminopimelate desuccinylase-like protein
MRTFFRPLSVALLAIALALPATAWAQAPRPDADPRIEKIVASISEERLKSLLEKLVSFGTRNTLSDQTSTTQGIGAARNWILEEMRRSSEKLRVSFDTHQIAAQGRITSAVDLRNVMAVLPGRSPRRIYVSGHYDTVNIGGQNVSNSSTPGAAIARRGRASIPMSRPTAPTMMAAAPC